MTTTDTRPTCPAWCTTHDPEQQAPVLHLSALLPPDAKPYLYRTDEPGAPTMVGVHLPEHDMTPQQALQLAADLISSAAAALEDVSL